MNREELVRQLVFHISNPQKSERWVTYRLVNPIVDHACETTGWIPYFEYVQASKVRTVQSIDVALLEENVPRIYIEVKKIDKELHPDLITKYLSDSIIGAVTNGCKWIFAIRDRSLYLSLLDDSSKFNEKNLDIIIRMLKCSTVEQALKSGGNWEAESRVIKSGFRKPQKLQIERAKKKVYPRKIFYSSAEAKIAVAARADIKALTKEFLFSFLDGSKGHPSHIRFEMNENRIVWFSSRLETKSHRLGRILLKGGIPDILIHAPLVRKSPSLEKIVASEIHKKTPEMRLFRFAEMEKARQFGVELGRIIRSI